MRKTYEASSIYEGDTLILAGGCYDAEQTMGPCLLSLSGQGVMANETDWLIFKNDALCAIVPNNVFLQVFAET